MFLARSVTGSYRAVKVVRREDFELERTFEREFEGIQRYEKVSQDHPGLVDVLHAGRNEREEYYYYVMELADDVESGAEIDPDHYQPHTLASDLQQCRLRPVKECVAVGAPLAEALGHLHAAGLTHRDVKPSNIIFVKGIAKLADIGLVARSGQRTYVGTEGYVPPEGPGTALADLYSLGMVLYEMGTGKDRLDFPELPTNMELPPTVNRDEWRALNGVVCRAGAPDAKRRFENGEMLAAALRRIIDPAPIREGSWRRGLAAAAAVTLAAVLGAGGYSAYRSHLTDPGVSPDPDTEKPGTGAGDPVTPPAGSDPNGGGEPPGPDTGMPSNVGELPDAFEIAGLFPRFFGESSGSGGSVSIKNPNGYPGDGRGVVFSDPPDGPPPPPAMPADPPPPPKAWLKITQPTGAGVWYLGKRISVTPTDFLEFEPGLVKLVLKARGYHDYELERELPPSRREIESEVLMIPDRAPVEGEPWRNSEGLAFISVGKRHISREPISQEIFDRFLDGTRYPFSLINSGGARTPEHAGQALADEDAMWAFCDWLTARDRAGGFLGTDRFHHPQPNNNAGGVQTFFSRIENRFGGIAVNSEPSGAGVYQNGNFLGRTPLTLENHRIGRLRLTLRLPGYRDAPADLEVRESSLTPLTMAMTRDNSVLFSETWTNSLGMPFVPVKNFMAADFETRVKDYAAFLESQPEGIEKPAHSFDQGPNHPVAGVNLIEARAFCLWLTAREREAGLIQDYHEYRVPGDLQWSAMAGLENEEGSTPGERDIRKVAGHFPWGEQWPPPAGAGNFADAAAGRTVSSVIDGYADTFEKTAPVGSFQPNPYDIHDLAGNVWEWIDEPYDKGSRYFFVRGGGWGSSQESQLLTSYRKALRPEFKRDGGEHGFRCVLVDTRISPFPK